MCKGIFNSVTGELYMPPVWKPLAPEEFGIKLVVATDVSKSKQMASTLSQIQKGLLKQFKTELADTKLFMNVETFQDNQRHSTGWSTTPKDLTSKATQWHCYQSDTKFSEAFSAMKGEDGDKANVMIIIGDRFDDHLQKTVETTRELNEVYGTRVFAIPTTSDANVQKSYKAIAEAGNGLALSCLSLGSGPDAVNQLIKEIVQTIAAEEIGGGLDALPAPANDQVSEVRKLLIEKW